MIETWAGPPVIAALTSIGVSPFVGGCVSHAEQYTGGDALSRADHPSVDQNGHRKNMGTRRTLNPQQNRFLVVDSYFLRGFTTSVVRISLGMLGRLTTNPGGQDHDYDLTNG
ncbi:hypothetical protein RRG08_039091 [Elysia crispata]|uniref:Uncharacterized protein n=1 Tax=Elysia crispata TaxID=231223 RepID=A0AAE0ZPL5_9GAST|nr:hypothetical protein RRG08_039091 [Elysia crispata]